MIYGRHFRPFITLSTASGMLPPMRRSFSTLSIIFSFAFLTFFNWVCQKVRPLRLSTRIFKTFKSICVIFGTLGQMKLAVLRVYRPRNRTWEKNSHWATQETVSRWNWKENEQGRWVCLWTSVCTLLDRDAVTDPGAAIHARILQVYVSWILSDSAKSTKIVFGNARNKQMTLKAIQGHRK